MRESSIAMLDADDEAAHIFARTPGYGVGGLLVLVLPVSRCDGAS